MAQLFTQLTPEEARQHATESGPTPTWKLTSTSPPQPDRQGSGWSPDTDRVSDASLITPPKVTGSADHKVTLQAAINVGVALEELVSRYHPIRVSENGSNYSVVLTNVGVPMDHDLELVWKPVPDESPRAMLFSETVGSEPYFLLMVFRRVMQLCRRSFWLAR